MTYIISTTPGGRIVREVDTANGFERAWRRIDDGRCAVSYTHKGPWHLILAEQVPAKIWELLTTEETKL